MSVLTTPRPRSGATAALLVWMVAFALFSGLVVPTAGIAREAGGVDEYEARVEIALEKVEAASGAVLDENTAGALAAEISTLLPAVEEVETDSGVFSVDNSILRTLASRLAASESTSDRARVLLEMRQHLESMSVAVAGDPALIGHDPEALKELLGSRRVSSRSPLSELFGSLVERIVAALQRWWESAGASPGASRAATTITLAVIALVLGLLVFVLVRALRRAMAARARPEDPLPGAIPPSARRLEPVPSDPLAAADRLAAEGRYTPAVRVLLGGAARMLATAGFLRSTTTRTNGELLSQVRSNPEVGEPLSGLAGLFDSAFYGHRETDAESYAAARGWYERLAHVSSRVGEDAR